MVDWLMKAYDGWPIDKIATVLAAIITIVGLLWTIGSFAHITDKQKRWANRLMYGGLFFIFLAVAYPPIKFIFGGVGGKENQTTVTHPTPVIAPISTPNTSLTTSPAEKLNGEKWAIISPESIEKARITFFGNTEASIGSIKLEGDKFRGLELYIEAVGFKNNETVVRLACMNKCKGCGVGLLIPRDTYLIDSRGSRYDLKGVNPSYDPGPTPIAVYRELKSGETYRFHVYFKKLDYLPDYIDVKHPQFKSVRTYLDW